MLKTKYIHGNKCIVELYYDKEWKFDVLFLKEGTIMEMGGSNIIPGDTIRLHDAKNKKMAVECLTRSGFKSI